MIRISILLALMIQVAYGSYAQRHLELIETNQKEKDVQKYAASYQMTTRSWLAANTSPDTLKGGNWLAPAGALTIARADSLSKLFRARVPEGIIGSSNTTIRMVYDGIDDIRPYFLTTIYGITTDSTHLTLQFKIMFDSTSHNQMPDIFDILVPDPEQILKHPPDELEKLLLRKPDETERGFSLVLYE